MFCKVVLVFHEVVLVFREVVLACSVRQPWCIPCSSPGVFREAVQVCSVTGPSLMASPSKIATTDPSIHSFEMMYLQSPDKRIIKDNCLWLWRADRWRLSGQETPPEPVKGS